MEPDARPELRNDDPPNGPDPQPSAEPQAPPPAAPARAPLGAALACLLAWMALGLVRLVLTNLTAPIGIAGLWLSGARALFDLGHVIALGLLSGALVLAFLRARARIAGRLAAVVDIAAVAVLAWALAFPILGPDLNDFATRLVEEHKWSRALAHTGLVLGVATGIPVVAAIARLLARPRLRVVAAALALFAAVWNHFVLTLDYAGAHLYLAWVAAILGAAALTTVPRPRRPFAASPRRRRVALGVALAALAALAGVSVTVRPSEVVSLALLNETGNTLAPFLLRMRAAPTVPPPANVPPELRPWFVDRSRAPMVPASQPPGRKTRIVILYTMDSVRGEVINSGKHDAIIPEMARMRREGAHFAEARAPGTSTSFTLTALFMGKYYSDQYWTEMPGEDSTYPWDDHSLRFPEILSAHRIRTIGYAGRKFMLNEYGMARGFDESIFIKPTKRNNNRANTGEQICGAARKRLEKHDGGPLFLWIHNMDPHAPYDLAGTEGTLYDRYVREVGVADKELGLLRAFIEKKGWADRTTWIISADHGEGFREHGTTSHGVSMYDELMRVPLVVYGPDVVPHKIDTMVSVIDIGPTVLDLFELPTPGAFMGESLLPLLRNQPANLTRPIGAETRLKQALILPSGIKIIRDQRLGTREIYDLKADPAEKHNIVEEPGRDGEALMNLLGAFFAIHTLKRPGYTPPYRTW